MRKNLKALSEIREEIMEPILAARGAERMKEEALDQFNQYLKIAKGDPDMAYTFFCKAYKENYSSDTWNYIDKMLEEEKSKIKDELELRK